MQNFSHVFFRLGYPRLSPSEQLHLFPHILYSMGRLLNSRSHANLSEATATASSTSSISPQLLSQVDSTFRMLLFVSLPLVVSSHAVCPRTLDALESLRTRHLLSASSSSTTSGSISPATVAPRENSLFRVSDPRASQEAAAGEPSGAALSIDEMRDCRTRCALADAPLARRRLLELLLDLLLLPYNVVDMCAELLKKVLSVNYELRTEHFLPLPAAALTL